MIDEEGVRDWSRGSPETFETPNSKREQKDFLAPRAARRKIVATMMTAMRTAMHGYHTNYALSFNRSSMTSSMSI
jgi:hypothetical protein